MFAERLKEARTAKKISMTELAKRVDTTKNTIWNYENGVSKAPLDVLIKIADVLSVSTDYLLGRIDSPYQEIPFSNMEINILEELKKYPDILHSLNQLPQENIRKLLLLWDFLDKEFFE